MLNNFTAKPSAINAKNGTITIDYETFKAVAKQVVELEHKHKELLEQTKELAQLATEIEEERDNLSEKLEELTEENTSLYEENEFLKAMLYSPHRDCVKAIKSGFPKQMYSDGEFGIMVIENNNIDECMFCHYDQTISLYDSDVKLASAMTELFLEKQTEDNFKTVKNFVMKVGVYKNVNCYH